MTIEITWTITAVIAVSSLLSPIFVALINNRNNAKIRNLELEHTDSIFEKSGTYTQNERNTYSKTLSEVTLALNQELESTKPVIQYEQRKYYCYRQSPHRIYLVVGFYFFHNDYADKC